MTGKGREHTDPELRSPDTLTRFLSVPPRVQPMHFLPLHSIWMAPVRAGVTVLLTGQMTSSAEV